MKPKVHAPPSTTGESWITRANTIEELAQLIDGEVSTREPDGLTLTGYWKADDWFDTVARVTQRIAQEID